MRLRNKAFMTELLPAIEHFAKGGVIVTSGGESYGDAIKFIVPSTYYVIFHEPSQVTERMVEI